MKMLRCAAIALLALGARAHAETYTIESKADWQTGTLSGVDLDTYSRPTILPSLTLTVSTDQGIYVESFENTVTAAAFWTSSYAFPNYVTQVGGTLPLHGSKMIDMRVVSGANFHSAVRTNITRTASMSVWNWDGNYSDPCNCGNNYYFGSGYAGDVVSFYPRGYTGETRLHLYLNGAFALYNALIKTGKWRYWRVEAYDSLAANITSWRLYLDGDNIYSVDRTPYLDRWGMGSGFSTGTTNPPGLDYMTISKYSGKTPNVINLNVPGGFRVDLTAPIASKALGVTKTTQFYNPGSTTTMAGAWYWDEPYLIANVWGPNSRYLGALTSTGATDGFIGNVVALGVTYTSGAYWEKAWSFGKPLTVAASVSWTTPTLPANTAVLLSYAVAVSPTAAFGAWTPVPGAGLPISSTVGNSEFKVRVTLANTDGVASPSISKLWVDFTNPNTSSLPTATATATPRPSLPFTTYNYPNPFKADGTASTRIVLDKNVKTTLHIYDPSGREVYTSSAQTGAGRAEFVWDGRDTKGELVASGIYFAKFDSDPNLICKVAVLRVSK